MSSLKIEPSPPPSPTEEDISRAGVYADSEAGASTATLTGGGTDRQRQKRRAAAETYDDESSDSSSDEETGRKKSYPPTNDEETEARIVAENLRRWEIAERERRRVARDSTSTVASSSLVGDVTRRASLLWPGRRSRQSSQGVGIHQMIPSFEEGVAMDEMDHDVATPHIPEPENPFTTPMASTVSLNTPQDSAIMTESSDSTLKELSEDTIAESGLRIKMKSRPPPPPQPLDIPEPRTPPPRTGSPPTHRAPEPIPPPLVSEHSHDEELPDKRWWTDWLCGCREHGDNQAARTNPFE